ncbi:hypothetical protein [Streptomyces sp. V4I23]|uniref:hypothetical protein n=1 Tax=Streptomyces sp. V4I23 TaxID=3042282 RepID=UPI0027D7871F|nr:hypothetical protein [Streptomyces sp. V4I23]
MREEPCQALGGGGPVRSPGRQERVELGARGNSLYTGPIAAALGGLDLSLPAGMIVSAVVYAVLMRNDRAVLAARAGA